MNDAAAANSRRDATLKGVPEPRGGNSSNLNEGRVPMIKPFRFSPSSLALSYVALSVLVLALFAIPLWYAWRVDLSTSKEYVHAEDVRQLVDVFEREGAARLAAAIESQTASYPRDEIVVLADASKSRVAGNLPLWPAEVPDQPGTYGLVISQSGSSMHVVAAHLTLPGGYHLLLGRESARFQSLVDYFWFGIATAMAIVLVLGAVIGWLIRRALLFEVQQMSRTAKAIVGGDLSRRLTTRRRSDALAALARTVNGMLEQLARRNVQLAEEIAVRRQVQQTLQQTHQDLESLVAQRTEQLQKTNESLRRSEAYLAEAQQLARVGSFGIKIESRELVCSEETLRIAAFEPGTKPTLEDALERVHPEDRARIQATLEQGLRDRSLMEYEHRLLLPDESIRHVHVVAHTIQDASNVAEFVGAVVDITERKKSQDALHAAKARFEGMLEIAEDAIISVDSGQRIVLFNQGAEKIFGYSQKEVIGESLDLLVPQRFTSAHRQHLEAFARSPDIARAMGQRREVFGVRKDGREFPAEASISKLDLGGELIFSVILRDVTERKQADEELRRQRTYLDELFELAPDAVVLTTLRNPQILRINREFTRMFGYTAEEAVGRHLRHLIAPDDVEPADLTENPDLLAGRKVEREVVRWRMDGTRFHAHITAKRVQLRDDEDAAYIIYRDITERKRAEALLAGEKRLLEVIAKGGPLATTLDVLCRLAEEVDGDSLVSILLLNRKGEHVRHGAAPSLAASYMAEIDGRPVGLGFGPCGAAAHLGEQVIASDIAADERWPSEYRALALAHGLRACWSTPITSSEGRVLGTFAIYWREPRSPTPQQRARIEQLTHLASIAIERAQAMDALRRSEERYARAMDAAGDGHTEWIVATDEFYASPRFLEMCGFPPDTTFKGRADFLARFPFHPDDRDRVIEAINANFAARMVQLGLEMRILRRGETRWHHLTGLCSRDATGALVRWNAAVTDVTDRKCAEAALQLSEERYARAMEAADEGHWEWNIETDEMFLSSRMKEMLGLAPDEQFASRAEFFDRQPIHPGDRQRVNEAREVALSGVTPRYEIEYRILPCPGELRWVRSRGKVFHDEQGRPLRISGSFTDITDWKLADEALRRSEEGYALAMEASGEGHWDWNIVNDEYHASPRMLELYGFPPGTTFKGRADFLARFPFHPEDRPRWEEAIAAHFAGETARFDIEIRMIPRGETRWIHLTGLLSRDASGKPVRWTGSAADITERRCAEDALRLSEHRYALAMEATGDGHWDWDIPSDKIYVSPLLLDICGLPPDITFASRSEWMDRFPFYTGERPRYEQAVAKHFAGKAARLDVDVRIVARGETGWVHLTGRCSRDASGKPIRWAGSVTDITARKRVAEELRARQDMLDLAQKVARAVAFEWRVGAGEGENRWSPDLEAMYGIAPGSYDGTYESWKKLVYADDWPKVRAAIKAAQQSGDVAAEYRVAQQGGAIRWLQAKGRMFFDLQGKPTRVVGFMLDVTDRRLAEEELQRMEHQLRQAQRLEAMGTLAGGIAHDFNNLLGAILGYGEMALRDVPAGSRLRRDVENIMIAGERGRALVDRILAFSRSGVGERVAVRVEAVARETLALFAAKLPRGIVIEQRLGAGGAAVMGDPTQIHQVLMNLVTNAVHAMSSGGTLRVSLDRVRVRWPRVATTGTVAARDYVVLEVADTGSGIRAEILEKIFDPFFTTKEVGVGSGLGLSLVHGIVTGLGGVVDVATTVGKGSVFKVYLPLAGDGTALSKPKKRVEAKTPRAGHGRVLVVDDEEALVRLATETLTALGYATVGFTASAAALDAFLADPEQFDAVITDESMAGKSGSELIRKMRAFRPTIPILLVSGYLSTAVVERAREAGASEVLKKPLSAHELTTALDRVLHATRARSANDIAVSTLAEPLAKRRRGAAASASRAGPVRR